MIRYKAGYKFVSTGVHAQVLDFPSAITWGADLDAARRELAVALVDVAEASLEVGEPLPQQNATISDPEMDIEEPIYLHFVASSEVREIPTGAVS
ncbi:MAG: type II toxin-antitoxin system HicB family antitoxin [Gemmataceae bacterium]